MHVRALFLKRWKKKLIHRQLYQINKTEKQEISQDNKLIESEMNKETLQQSPRKHRIFQENILKFFNLLSWKKLMNFSFIQTTKVKPTTIENSDMETVIQNLSTKKKKKKNSNPEEFTEEFYKENLQSIFLKWIFKNRNRRNSSKSLPKEIPKII